MYKSPYIFYSGGLNGNPLGILGGEIRCTVVNAFSSSSVLMFSAFFCFWIIELVCTVCEFLRASAARFIPATVADTKFDLLFVVFEFKKAVVVEGRVRHVRRYHTSAHHSTLARASTWNLLTHVRTCSAREPQKCLLRTCSARAPHVRSKFLSSRTCSACARAVFS